MTADDTAISVVIATLGGCQLKETLAHLNDGDLRPAEIIIAIPGSYEHRALKYLDEHENVRIMRTNSMGQVAQRAEGFAAAKHRYVLQMDDDVHVDRKCLLLLRSGLAKHGHKTVVGPVFVNQQTRQPLSRMPQGWRAWAADLYFTSMWGLPKGAARMGTFSPLGMAISVDPTHCQDEYLHVRWLAGGCTLGFREELVLESFYPVSGKAYAEDLLHSALRQQRGIRHIVVVDAVAGIEPPSAPRGLRALVQEHKAKMAVAQKLGANRARFVAASAVECLRRLAR